MPTFLTTSKMDPALAARIEVSVRGRDRKAAGATLPPRLVAVVRFAVVLGAVIATCSFAMARRHDKREIDGTRAALLANVHGRAATLTAEDRGAVARMEAWLVPFSGAYEGDFVADELRAPGAFAAAMTRQAVYVRGPVAMFVDPPKIAETAATSAKDSLLLCLLEPPPSRVEKDMLPRVRIAYGRGTTMEEHTPNVRRLHDAEVGLPFLLPRWSERVLTAEDPNELLRLRRDFEKAPIEAAKQALRASLLVFAMDEPGDGAGPTELDGERAHAVRIGVVDIATKRPLLRVRKVVDPTWISLAKKSEYATGLDGCALALDVHEHVAHVGHVAGKR
jgi:hypothetical protein